MIILLLLLLLLLCSSSSSLLLLLLLFIYLFISILRYVLCHLVAVRALRTIFHQWNIKAIPDQWNISGEPCSAAAIDSTIKFENELYNPFIKCECSFNNDSVCHITQLYVIISFSLSIYNYI